MGEGNLPFYIKLKNMGIYNRPKKKVWQNLGENITKFGPLTGSGAPTFIPEAAGVIYIDIDGKDVYISVGIETSSDWRLMIQD
jgi:hypothetical protein